MKRVLSFILVLSMIVGSISMVAAAPAESVSFDDVEDKVIAKAVDRLKAFGIVDGYEDGTYRPEQDVTREEFAKLIVTALGMEHAANAVKYTKFADVEDGRWSAGYVAVAAGQGLIIGDPDGNFRPADKVSYAEAVTMLVRALGYRDEFLKGAWPGNFIAKAAEAGVSSGVRFANADGYADRGDVAVLVNNTLDADVVKVQTYKDGTIEYEESDITLLKDKLDISKYEDTRVIADKILDDGLSEDEVTVLFTKDIDKDDDSVKKSYKEGTTKDFTFKEGVNPRLLIGEEVSVYMNDRDEVIYIESEDDDRAEIDYIVEIDKDNKDEISLAKLDKEYKFDKNAYVYVYNSSDDRYDDLRGDDMTEKKIADLELPGSVGKFVIKNNRVIFAEIYKSSEADPMLVVMDNNKGELEGINKDTEDYKLDLTKDGTYDYALVYDIYGNKMDVEDIEKGNVVYAQFLDYDGDDVALVRVVTDNVIKGEVGRFREDRVEIDGKFKTAVKFNSGSGMEYSAYYTINTLEDIEQWADSDWENDFDDAYGEDATVYLDAVGRIAFLSTGAESVSGYKFGVVTRTYADGDRVRIFTSLNGKDGEDIVFKADKERNLTNPKVIKYVDGKFTEPKEEKVNVLGAAVKFRLNRDGEIDENEFYVMDREAVFAMRADFGKDTMRVVSLEDLDKDVENKGKEGKQTSFSVKDGVTIIDAEGLNPLNTAFDTDRGDIEAIDTKVDIDDFDAVEWKDIKDTKKDDDIRFYVFPRKNKDEEAEGVVFVGKAGANTASDKEAIYVRDRWRKGDDIIIEYIVYGSDERKQATVDGSFDISDIERRSPYVAEERSNNKLRLYPKSKSDIKDGKVVEDNDVHFMFVKGIVDDITGSRVKVNGKTYTIDNKAVVYEKGDKKSTSSIKKDEEVLMIVEDDIKVRVVQLLGKPGEKKDDIKDGEYEVDAVVSVRGNVWITIDKVDYLFSGSYEEAKAFEGKVVTFKSREIDGDNVITEIKLVEDKDPVDPDPVDPVDPEEPGDEEITATWESMTYFGVTNVDVKVEGAKLEDVEEVLVNGDKVDFEIYEGEVITFNFGGTVETVEIVVDGKNYDVVKK